MSTPLLVGAGAAVGAAKVGLPAQAQGLHGLVQDYWTAVSIALLICVLAYFSNPNAASFRTHLTQQSFQANIRRLESPSRNPAAASSSAGSAQTSGTSTPNAGPRDGPPAASATSAGAGKRKVSGPSPADRAAAKQAASSSNRHILSFSNRISLSIKTPSYKFTSYYLFSTVYCPPSRPSGATRRQQQQLKKHPEVGALLGLGGELWLGLFGKWYALKLWDNEEQEEEERRGRLERGVKEIRVEDDERNADFLSCPPSHPSSASGSSTPAHSLPASSLDRASSISSHHVDSVPPVSPTSKNTPAAARLAKRVFRAGQRRSSPTSLTRLKTKAEHAAREAAEAEKQAADEAAPAHSASPSKTAGANGSGGASTKAVVMDPILIELQAQLDELRATAAESEKRLQDELEVLRGKKRDEDAFRAELKAKTKMLEEAKRVAEASRVEVEKDLNERKNAVREVQGRVDKLREEIRALERKGMEVVERKEKKKRDRREREKKLREDVLKKREELKEKEKGLEVVMQKVGEMERKLEVRRALLASRRAELAQLAVAGVRGPLAAANQHPGASNVYSIPPSAVPTTATFGGVGAVANAFAVPFGQGAYGRRNYPYVHPLSANNSRPGSIRSGHFDPLTGAFQSAPSSPTLSHPVSPHDEALAPYNTDSASGWPASYANIPPGTASGNGSTTQHPHSGFLEHRLQHRAANASDDVPSHFLPFDFDSLAHGDDPSPPTRSQRADSLAGSFDDSSPGANKPRAPLALPLQYLDSGLLATTTPGTDSPSVDVGPLSPMTPHQASLIPSQLFHMLDEDEDDDALFAMPDSPTLRGANGLGVEWKGLGLDVDELGGSRRNSGSRGDGMQMPPAVEEHGEEEALNLSPRAETFSLAVGGGAASATTSPIGPPPASPFSPWDANVPSTGASLEPPLYAAPNAISHRLSPSQDLADDLPRAGLSLNPDAKAFAFPFMPAGVAAAQHQHQQQHAHARTSSVPSPPTNHAVAAAVRASRSGTSSSFPGSSLPSPTTLTPTSGPAFDLDPPPKSRMGFAKQPSDGPLSARLSPGFDWPKANPSPKFAPAVAPIGTGSAAGTGGTASGRTTPVPPQASFNPFNPFDEEDELLGPLKK
ncbi:hypothetical protein JCM10213_006903 [Rhodosporidiobolus nylandii]